MSQEVNFAIVCAVSLVAFLLLLVSWYRRGWSLAAARGVGESQTNECVILRQEVERLLSERTEMRIEKTKEKSKKDALAARVDELAARVDELAQDKVSLRNKILERDCKIEKLVADLAKSERDKALIVQARADFNQEEAQRPPLHLYAKRAQGKRSKLRLHVDDPSLETKNCVLVSPGGFNTDGEAHFAISHIMSCRLEHVTPPAPTP